MVPIWSAAIAIKVYDENLQTNHLIGMIMLTICMALISLSNVFDSPKDEILIPLNLTNFEKILYEPITPVVFALLATMLMGINMNIVKYYSRQGFPPDVFAFSCYGLTNIV